MSDLSREIAQCEAEVEAQRERPFAQRLPKTRFFKAWRITPKGEGNPRNEAGPVDLPDWVETAEQAAQSCSTCLTHKACVLVLRRDDALRPALRNLVTMFYVKRRSRRGYIRLNDGTTAREPEFYPDFVTEFCVADGFSPIEPFKMTRETTHDDIAGFDRTLVEGGAK
jgi:hypothetical protein